MLPPQSESRGAAGPPTDLGLGGSGRVMPGGRGLVCSLALGGVGGRSWSGASEEARTDLGSGGLCRVNSHRNWQQRITPAFISSATLSGCLGWSCRDS